MYFSRKGEESEENKGIYCGEGNNFLLIKPKICWPDTLQKYSNTYINSENFKNSDNFLI